MTSSEERDLSTRIVAEDCAASRAQLMRAHLNLVVEIARTYRGRGFSHADLIQAGMAGLVRAVEDFESAYAARFSTCASWWIKDAIRQAFMGPMRFVAPPPDTAA
jgi:RNA polymerase primary sigma factor